MADGTTELNAGAGGSIMDDEVVTYGSSPTSRHRERIEVAGALALEIARVNNVDAAQTDYGLVVRPVQHQLIKSTGNSSTATLAASATFSGTGEDVSAYQGITINLFGAPAKAQGTLYFEFSPDNTNWDVSVPVQINDIAVVIPIPLRVVEQYFRVRFTNGTTTLTTTRITVYYHATSAEDLTRTPTQTVGPNEPVKVVRAMVEPGLNHGARTMMAADRTTYGSGTMAERVNQVEADFADALTSNDVTTTLTNGGTATVASGLLTLASTTNANGTSKVVSTAGTNSSPSQETFCDFDVAFTTPTASTSEQRAGIYDASNGFFIGYHGLTFGFTLRSGAADTFTALTAANGDPLDGSFLSRFTRGGVLEAFDPTKLNSWRVRSSANDTTSVLFEVLSPDGVWMLAHSIRWPNANTTALLQSNDQPITMEVTKTASDATNLKILTTTWAAGITGTSVGFRSSQVRARTHVDANAAAVTAATTTLYTVPAGHTFFMTAYQLSATNTSLAAIGAINVRDNATVKIPHSLATSTAQVNSTTTLAGSFDIEPLPFTTSVVLANGAGTVTASLCINGYIERT